MKNTIVFFALGIASLCGGCGLIALFGSTPESQKKVPAEYDLALDKGRRILILVEQPHGSDVQANLRYYLTHSIEKSLVKKVRLPAETLVDYEKLLAFRSGRGDFSFLPPAQVGRELGAEIVLLVMINELALTEIGEGGYFKGLLTAEAVLIDVTTQTNLWPKSRKGKSIRVGFEIEEQGRDAAVKRLANASAHCITRHFYNCKKGKFKIPDDKSDPAWGQW